MFNLEIILGDFHVGMRVVRAEQFIEHVELLLQVLKMELLHKGSGGGTSQRVIGFEPAFMEEKVFVTLHNYEKLMQAG